MLVTQSCLTLCNPVDCSPPDCSVHEILLARILEWEIIPFSRGSSWCRDQVWVSCTAGRFFTVWATREAHICVYTHTHTHTFKFASNIFFWLTLVLESCKILGFRVKTIKQGAFREIYLYSSFFSIDFSPWEITIFLVLNLFLHCFLLKK